MPFARYYLVSMCVCWWASGAAYLVSALLPPATVLMSGVFVSLILGAFIHVSVTPLHTASMTSEHGR